MSRKRGLSVEEKRKRLLEIFYEKKDFFQLKELEKIAPKEKGITLQSVKDVLQSLVDDNLVDSERIGTSNYFWAFPSKAVNIRKRKLDELEKKKDLLGKRKEELSKQLSEAEKVKEQTPEHVKVLEMLSERKLLRDGLKEELEGYSDCDPQVLKKLKVETNTGTEAVNRWTENLFVMKTWCRDKFGVEETMIDKQFNIPDDLDYI